MRHGLLGVSVVGLHAVSVLLLWRLVGWLVVWRHVVRRHVVLRGMHRVWRRFVQRAQIVILVVRMPRLLVGIPHAVGCHIPASVIRACH